MGEGRRNVEAPLRILYQLLRWKFGEVPAHSLLCWPAHAHEAFSVPLGWGCWVSGTCLIFQWNQMVLTQAHHTLTLNCLLKQNSVSLLLTQVQGQKEKWPLLNKMKPVPIPLRTSGHVEEMCNHILLGLPLLWEVDRIAKITMRGSKLVGQGGADQRTRRPMVLKWMASLRGKVLRSRKRSYHFTYLLSLTLASLTSKRQIQVDKPLASHEPTR